MRAAVLFIVFLFSSLAIRANEKPLLKFIENKNQWESNAHYRAAVNGGYMFLKNNGFSFVFIDQRKVDDAHYENNFSSDDSGQPLVNCEEVQAWHLNSFFRKTNNVTPIGVGASEEYYNYFLGNDKGRWGINAHSYSDVVYKNFYDGIDLRVYSKGLHAKYDLVVRPGGTISSIQWSYEGAESLYLENGNLYATTELANVIERKPYAYQIKDGCTYEVPVQFVLNGKDLQYYLPEGYDDCYELIIDPILIFSAYSGSIQDNWGNTAAYDSRGNTYSGGIVNATFPTGFPSTAGAYQVQAKSSAWDIGILKYDSSGSKLLYATYLGGNSVETPQSLVVDADDNLLILGATSSLNFPVTTSETFKGGTGIDPLNGIPYSTGSDIFVAKLNKEGNALLASTFFGGTSNDGINFISGSMGTNQKTESPLARNYGDQLRGDIIVDQQNNVLIASNTLSNDLPASLNSFGGGSHDAVVARFSSTLEIMWSRYLGGSDTDAAYSIKVKENSLVVAGGTESNDFLGINGFHTSNMGGIDGWIAEVLLDGSAIINGTYLGTNAYDQVYFIDINENDEVYAFGQTRGAYPVQGNVYSNANGGQFIHKLSADLQTSLLSTVIGSGGNSPNISPTAFLVSDCDNLYLSGWGGDINATNVAGGNGIVITRNYVGGSTVGLPTTQDAFQRNTSGNDFYFMVLSADASEFLYGTYLGGSTSRTHVDGGTSRFDKQGIVYHAVCAGCGGQSDFPAVNVPAAHQLNRSQNCNNAVFKFDLSLLRARLQTNNLTHDMPGISKVCIPDPIVFQNFSTGGEIFEWDLGNGETRVLTDTASFVYFYPNPGTYVVKLTAIDQGTCKVRDIATKTIVVDFAQSEVQEDDIICEGDTYQLQASGGAAYRWVSKDGLSIFTEQNPFIKPAKTTEYVVTITENSGCIQRDTVTIEVVPGIIPEFVLEREVNCLMRPYISVKNPKADSVNYTFIFDFGDGEQSDLPETEHQYEVDSTYRVKLIAQREFCVYEEEQVVDVSSVLMPNVITPLLKEGKNDVFTIHYGKEKKTPAEAGLKVALLVYNRWGTTVFKSSDYQYDWSGEELVSGVYFYEVTIEGYATCKDWIHVIK